MNMHKTFPIVEKFNGYTFENITIND